MAAGMVVTFSRSSALMLMLGLLLLAIRAVGPVKALGTAAVLLIVLGGAAAASSGNIRHAATSGNRLERVSEGRFDLVRGGLTIWRADPVAGAGLGAFEKRFEQTLTPVEQRRVRVVISHNAPVTVLSEEGVIGFALFLILIVRHGLGRRARLVRGRATSAGRGGPSGPCSRASSCTACCTRRCSRTRSPGSSRPRPCPWPPARAGPRGRARAHRAPAAARHVSASAPGSCASATCGPAPDDPDYGSFVADMCDALRARGLPVEPW